ncbi:site-specific recombinase XerD [Sphaerotilus hippei]|uniref:Site-specific recombinase XerD n=1 Tax=Sphaerotilus hippei TaxID=744406 RepID=A0A318GZQ3_9BURK|nr:tyrosine-type recombinase/integrase [Sphaerotilus hippei]PXW93414.1 site-specific recombinase XerD [Sphaerotilus hippei]
MTSTLRLGVHHFAHLRAVAEGMSITTAAARYLGVEHGHEAGPRHRAIVLRLQTLARRRGDTAWRLIGMTIRLRDFSQRPSLEAFIADRDLDGWREDEVAELYQEAYPPEPKAERRWRLRERQMRLLRELEAEAAQQARPSDRIDDWFDPACSRRLQSAGLLRLQDLLDRVAPGGRWWSGVPAIGRTKARGIEAYLRTLLPAEAGRPTRPFALPPGTAAATLPSSTRSIGTGQAGAPAALTQARTDAEALEAWVQAKAGSPATATSYLREGRRLLLWLHQERSKGLHTMQVEDCLAYMAFLEHLPPHWLSHRQATPFSPAWAPFRGQLSVASRRQAIVILGGWFDWLTGTAYLPGRNPWLMVNRRTADDRQRDELQSRAFTPETWARLLQFMDGQAPTASLLRMRFIMSFVEATGLRSSELLEATLGQFRRHRGRWALQVHGKGSRNRVIAVPGQAIGALEHYLAARHLPPLASAPATLPVLASTREPLQAISYSALYQTMKSWLARAVRHADLDLLQRSEARQASPHWLRHTCGTRAVERGTPLDVVQHQFGHSDPRTTARYSRAQLERMQDLMEAAFDR